MSSRKRIGFITRIITSPVGFAMWEGVLNGAKKHNVELVTIDADYMGKDGTLLYEFAKKHNFDGILSWAANKIDDYTCFFHERIDVPIVTLTQPIDPYPVIKIDSYTSMKLAVKHLIQEHGIKDIAFVRGEANNAMFQDRFRAYRDALEEFGGNYSDKLITEPFNSGTAVNDIANIRHSIKTLIHTNGQKPGVDFKAILTVTELTSLGLIDVLKEEGYKIPDDVAVISYDNSLAGRFLKPKPTAMILPFQEQAEGGVRLLLDKLNGKQVDKTNTIPGYLEVNMSCGCEEHSLEMANAKNKYTLQPQLKKKKKVNQPVESFSDIKDEVVNNFLEHASDYSKKTMEVMDTLKDLTERTVSAFIGDIERTGKYEATKIIDELLKLFDDHELPFVMLQNLVSIIRDCTITNIKSEEKLSRIENQFHSLRASISIGIEYFEGRKSALMEQQNFYLSGMVRTISLQHTLEGIFSEIEQHTHVVDLKEFYVVLYENPMPYNFKDPLPDTANFAFGIKNHKRIHIDESNRVFPTMNILPENVKMGMKKDNVVIKPLISEGIHLGYIVFSDCPVDRLLYQSITDQLSSSIFGAKLIKDREKAEEQSTLALQTLKQKAEIITQNTESINQLIEGMTKSMDAISNNIKLISNDVVEVVNESSVVVKESNEANNFVNDLNNKALEIDEVIKLIADIAEKTNVLSINARIESARAGIHGKGFAVVANEINNLSKQTNYSTEQVYEIIAQMQSGSASTLDSMSNINKIIQNIYSLTESINSMIDKHINETQKISEQLIEASEGSREIFTEISEFAQD